MEMCSFDCFFFANPAQKWTEVGSRRANDDPTTLPLIPTGMGRPEKDAWRCYTKIQGPKYPQALGTPKYKVPLHPEVLARNMAPAHRSKTHIFQEGFCRDILLELFHAIS